VTNLNPNLTDLKYKIQIQWIQILALLSHISTIS